jgi:hypothetical protein
VSNQQTIRLPCGAMGFSEEENCGFPAYRCMDCLAIWGSIGCACSEKQRAAKAPKLYTRSNGKTIPLAEMAVPHLQAAIAKLKGQGYISRGDLSLFQTDPEFQQGGLVVSDVLGDLEIELKGRMG